MDDIFKIVKKFFGTSATVEQKNKDIYVKSSKREEAKMSLEKHFKSKDIKFSSVFKSGKSKTLDVLSITGLSVDIVFKPVIQKGKGGLDFEHQLEIDLNNYYNGVEYSKLVHADVIKALEASIKINRSEKMSVTHEGSKNQKRTLVFNNGEFSVTNNTGSVLTDLTLSSKNNSKKPFYLSLKLTKTYYTINGSVGKYFLDDDTKVKINEYFGFDGQSMASFGEEYACITKKPDYKKVSERLANLLDMAVGHNVVIVHKKQPNDVYVKKVGSKNSVTISGLSEDSYTYPQPGRKGGNIKFNAVINGTSYIVNMQFRGTTAADKGPKYLRVLLERK